MIRLLLAATVAVALVHPANAKRAQCTVANRHDPTETVLAFEVDDDHYPHVLNIRGQDQNAASRDLIDIPLYEREAARIETWYLSRVERTVDQQRSIYRMYYGEYFIGLGGVSERNAYVLYLDWEHGTAGFLDELLAFNRHEVVEKRPHLVIWPASCRRLD